jgi:hypothetical protein
MDLAYTLGLQYHLTRSDADYLEIESDGGEKSAGCGQDTSSRQYVGSKPRPASDCRALAMQRYTASFGVVGGKNNNRLISVRKSRKLSAAGLVVLFPCSLLFCCVLRGACGAWCCCCLGAVQLWGVECSRE